MNPTVSVIIPCYNQARFLPECIASLQAQTYPHWEAVIVNDGSPDDTRAVALKLSEGEPRVRYVEQENRGLSGARNSGTAQSHGVYLQYLDSDDILEPDKLRYQVEFLERRLEVGIVYGDVRYFRTEAPWERTSGPSLGEDDNPWIARFWKEEGSLLAKLARYNLMTVNCPLIRRSVMQRIGPWNEKLGALEDWEYWIRCAAAGVVFEFANPPQTLALVRQHALSMTQEQARMLQGAFDLRVAVAGAFIKHSCYSDVLKMALYLADALGEQGRASRYLRLFRAFTHRHARREIAKSYFLSPLSVGNKANIWLKRKVPWPIQKMLTRIAGKGAPK